MTQFNARRFLLTKFKNNVKLNKWATTKPFRYNYCRSRNWKVNCKDEKRLNCPLRYLDILGTPVLFTIKYALIEDIIANAFYINLTKILNYLRITDRFCDLERTEINTYFQILHLNWVNNFSYPSTIWEEKY